MENSSVPPTALLEALINHLVLPPRLPGRQEAHLDAIGRELSDRILDAVRIVGKVVNGDEFQQWDTTRHVLQVAKDLNARAKLNKASLLTEFRRVEINSFLILHVVEQNAGLLIRRRQGSDSDVVIFEAFEASPLSEKVLAAKSALQWDFPDFAVAIPYAEFMKSAFQEALADFLEQASTESIKRFAATTNKAGSCVYESRETVDPSLITHMLMTLLEAMGHQIQLSLVRKRVRDEVSWADGAENPWRRCAYWLVIRVGIHRHLCECHGQEVGKLHYKFVLCVLLAGLLDDATDNNVNTELLMTLRAKLARRLAKLTIEKGKASPSLLPVYDHFFTAFGRDIRAQLTRALASVEATWTTFTSSTRRKIQRLRPRAKETDVHLSLPNSGTYLTEVLSWYSRTRCEASNIASHGAVNHMDDNPVANPNFTAFAGLHFKLSCLETELESYCQLCPSEEREQDCIDLACEIDDYIDAVGNAYSGNTMQTSKMLLTIMELWIRLDESACEVYSLLVDFDPGFVPEMLDVLQLPLFRDMRRLQEIQKYIDGRKKQCSSPKTIFEDPVKGCFAERYFNESENSWMFRDLLHRIETKAESAREAKEKEWRSMNTEFENLQIQIAESKCLYLIEGDGQVHDDRQCRRCYLGRVARRTKIRVHEHPLPADSVQKKAAVFELRCPQAFSAYRTTTWRIMASLACAKPAIVSKPCLLLHEYSGLESFNEQNPSPGVCLASSTKSFLYTHYQEVRFPVTLDRVCVPNGLKLEYYDPVTASRPAKQSQNLTFIHHCHIQIPERSPFGVLSSSILSFADSDGPSSYEILASQTKCPSALNELEYMTFQSLLSKRKRRWISILTELASSNLNFSSEATTLLISQLAIQAGPDQDAVDVLRTTHSVFRDIQFCKSLMAQVNVHLNALASNWREVACMDMLLTLILRLCSLGPAQAVSEAVKIAEKARTTTLKWLRQLRSEIHRSTTAETALRCSNYAFWAALLCIKTYAIYSPEEHHFAGLNTIDPMALECYLECSIALQDNIVCKLEDLSPSAKSLLIQDLKIIFHLSSILRKSLEASPTSLQNAINSVWPSSHGAFARTFSRPIFCQQPHECARARGTILEFIPHHVFGNHANFDVPAPLALNCVHWLDLETGVLEIRREPDIWTSKPSNWLLNFGTRRVQRRGSLLVDPHSRTFREIARIFEHFELCGHLTVYQPAKSTLCVELRRLGLSFFVDRENGLLHCRQLGAEIDPDQDAGTWYGLASKLIMRHARNHRQRTILVPLGSVTTARDRFHVTIRAGNDGVYAKFTINDILGRLECPPEPRLLYLKAFLHACTSFVLHDPLTGRTGTEEALHCLKSGYCQPWTILSAPASIDLLSSIAKLSPSQEYYPKGMKRMQQTRWDPRLTSTIQDEELRNVVQQICVKLDSLSTFSAAQPRIPDIKVSDESHHLSRRSLMRRRLHVRSVSGTDDHARERDTQYVSRGRLQNERTRNKIFEAASLIYRWIPKLYSIPNLASLLQPWTNIGGFDRTFDRAHISGLLEIDLALDWGSIVNKCRLSKTEERYELMFMFAIFSYGLNIDLNHVRCLFAFTIIEELKQIEPPTWPSYTAFRFKKVPNVDQLTHLIKDSRLAYPSDVRALLGSKIKPSLRRNLEEDQRQHEQQTEKDARQFVQSILEQWPRPNLLLKDFPRTLSLDISHAMETIQPEWLRLIHNHDLSNYIEKVQKVLDRCQTHSRVLSPPAIGCIFDDPPTRQLSSLAVSLPHLLSRPRPLGQSSQPASFVAGSADDREGHTASVLRSKQTAINDTQSSYDSGNLATHLPPSIKELGSIFVSLANTSSIVRTEYARYMLNSLNKFKLVQRQSIKDEVPFERVDIDNEVSRAKELVHTKLNQIKLVLQQGSEAAVWLQHGSLWPCVTPVALLEQLRSTSTTPFADGMRESLIDYGVSITALQRLLRIQDAHLKGHKSRFLEEQRARGHDTWQPLDYPDWLLLEIDANILIRPDQIAVALATICPPLQSNSVLQMNMGQGKTSCIMPMAAAVLANSRQLVRLIVPSSLLLQTAQILQSRIGGLVGREVRHVPFSRRTSTNDQTIAQFLELHEDLKASSGVIIALPEHILSFKLSGLQRLSDGRLREAAQMIDVEARLQQWSRDILDESDFTLAVRTQLVYPSGSQSTVDGHPHRWEAVQALLGLVHAHLWDLQRKFPQSIEVVGRPLGGFPLVFFLRSDVEKELTTRLVNQIACGQGSILSTHNCDGADRRAIEQFISEASPDQTISQRIHRIFAEKPAEKQVVYLIRGLLVHRILLLTLKKRWNVQYGLHASRDPIAVPYHAKGVPSEQAEWGHPDVAILFTCLSFYYGGLDLSQLRETLEHLVKSDDPCSEYDRWTHDIDNLPPSLRLWNTINVGDEIQLSDLWDHLRYKTAVIDYFLNRFVFPRHAKQFQTKLQASGWDIPLFSLANRVVEGQSPQPRPLTTGFSGTNDNRTLLPLTIRQDDLPAFSHTNAEVLTYLLQPRSREYVLAADSRGRHLSEQQLLVMLYRKGIRILIDAGAQILEMDNISLAKAWLAVDHEAVAAVFFNIDNKLIVTYRNGSETPLVATPFVDNLEGCLIYLDEAHTRGTDLKLPLNAVGALTLGLGQTKDHTVQGKVFLSKQMRMRLTSEAAMRLRQLATSQSIVFIAPPEVHQSIIDLRKKSFISDKIDSSDVICWLLEQTCDGLEQMQPLYYAQGTDFCRRTQAAFDSPDVIDNAKEREDYVRALRESEKQTLQQLYKPRPKLKPSKTNKTFAPELASFMKDLNERRKVHKGFGEGIPSSALQEVEQEREVAFEVEAVREVQKPRHYKALTFPGLHQDIVDLVLSGRLAATGTGYEHWITALERTAVGQKHGIQASNTKSRLFVSIEFSRTVTKPNDNFVRPVNWILWSEISKSALILIPEEVDLVLPILHDTAKSHNVYLLTYAAPVIKKMLLSFKNLNFYTVPALPPAWQAPSWLTLELGLFAGRLYFTFEEYAPLRASLGLDNTNGNGNDNRSLKAQSTPIQRPIFASTVKVLPFLQDWLALRRRGQDFSHTPMGFVVRDKELMPENPFFKVLELQQSADDDESLARREREEVEDGYDGLEDYDGGEDGEVEEDGEDYEDSEEDDEA